MGPVGRQSLEAVLPPSTNADELVRRALLCMENGRYFLPAAVRAEARLRIVDSSANQRHAKRYGELALSWLESSREGPLEVLADEIADAAAAARHEPERWRPGADAMALALAEIYRRRGPRAGVVPTLTKAIERPGRPPGWAGRMHARLAQAFAENGQLEQAQAAVAEHQGPWVDWVRASWANETLLESARAGFAAAGLAVPAAHAEGQLAVRSDDFDRAPDRLRPTTRPRALAASATVAVSAAERAFPNHLPAAEHAALSAIDAAESCGDHTTHATAAYALVAIRLAQGATTEAVELATNALERVRAVGSLELEAGAVFALGVAHAADGDWAAAIVCFADTNGHDSADARARSKAAARFAAGDATAAPALRDLGGLARWFADSVSGCTTSSSSRPHHALSPL